MRMPEDGDGASSRNVVFKRIDAAVRPRRLHRLLPNPGTDHDPTGRAACSPFAAMTNLFRLPISLWLVTIICVTSQYANFVLRARKVNMVTCGQILYPFRVSYQRLMTSACIT